MQTILIAYAPPILGMCIITYLVFLRMSQSRVVYGAFCLMMLLLVLWMTTQFTSLLVPDQYAIIALRLSFIFSSFMLASLMLFALLYPLSKKYPSPPIIALIFLPAILFSLAWATPYVYKAVENDGIHQSISTGVLYEAQGYYLLVYSIITIALLARRARLVRGATRRGVILLLVSFVIPIVINVVANYVFKIDSSLVQYFWPVSFFLMTSSIAYAMIRHRLFDIKLAAVRSAAYILVLITLSAVYYILAYVVSITLFKGEVSSTVSISPINIVLALLLAFIFQPIKSFFDKTTDTIFYRDRYDSDEFIARLSRVLTSTTDLRSLMERAATEIGATLKAEQAFLFVYHMQDHHISAGTLGHSSLPVQDARRLDAYANEHDDTVILAELLPDDHAIHRLLSSHKISILLPLTRADQVIGYLALGEQLSSGYTSRDIKVLTTISDELVIAVQNSLSVQEVRDINVHLQQRIDAATQQLRSSNTQLRHLDATKDEFLSMASHQLRTPLTSVKGYLSMVLEGDAGKVTDMQKHLLGEAFISSERMVHLIHDFLNVSRLQTGKFMLEQHPFDLSKLVSEEVDSLRHTAEARKLKLEFVDNTKLPLLNIDENKIRQVVMNFIDNALFYSHQDTTITIELNQVIDSVELRVKDTGIGVPKKEQEQLFSKFYRASNARKQRPDGTGVGLFLAKKVIVAHGGDVLFETVENKGSTFGFTLPIKNLLVEPIATTNPKELPPVQK